MREIEFRGKNSNNEWLYGYLTKQVGNDCYIIEGNDYFGGVIENTIGQYTGLKDKNGTKIFEGDILWDAINEEYGVVEYFENAFILVVDNVMYREIEDFEAREVAGNIYDNPELLNGGAQC